MRKTGLALGARSRSRRHCRARGPPRRHRCAPAVVAEDSPYGHLRVTPTVNAGAYRLRRTSLKPTGPHTARRTRTDRPLPCQGQLPAGVGGRDGTRLTNNVELEPASALLRLIGPLAGLRVRPAVARNVAAEAGPGKRAPKPKESSDVRDRPAQQVRGRIRGTAMTPPDRPVHVVFGATGAVGTAVVAELVSLFH